MQKYFSRKITRKFFYSFAFFLITSFLTGTILFPVKIVSLASSGNSMENSLNPLSDNSGINELSNRLKNITTSNNISVQAATDSTSNVSYQTNSESSSASSANTGFQSAAPNAILMEATTGTILYEKDADKEKPDLKEYARRLEKEGYTRYSDFGSDEEEKPVSEAGPYVIPPEQFGDNEEHEQISLTYYADGVLADENDEVIEDVEDAVGIDSLNHFGEYEDDSVFVRNDARKCDYEILLDQRTYSEVVEDMPHQMEV